MIKKYTDAEFENGKSRQLFPLECIYCGTIFYRKKHIIQGSKNKEKTFVSLNEDIRKKEKS